MKLIAIVLCGLSLAPCAYSEDLATNETLGLNDSVRELKCRERNGTPWGQYSGRGRVHVDEFHISIPDYSKIDFRYKCDIFGGAVPDGFQAIKYTQNGDAEAFFRIEHPSPGEDEFLLILHTIYDATKETSIGVQIFGHYRPDPPPSIIVPSSPPPNPKDSPANDRTNHEDQLVHGYWNWNLSKQNWVWIAGHWATPPAGFHSWQDPKYSEKAGTKYYQPGYWTENSI